jgi:peptidyl-tRNA hydrolase, PTH1 family
VKVIACLGNPGSQYSTTRHNVGWWLADELADRWVLGRFKREGSLALAAGSLDSEDVRVVKPLSFMNRSGPALVSIVRQGFDVQRDLLLVVDDVALDVGRVRLRASGSAGGHNGLKSVEASLRTRDYARLRIGVGAKPAGVDLSDWVLSSPSREDRRAILDLMPDLVDCVGAWVRDGVEAAMNRCNR